MRGDPQLVGLLEHRRPCPPLEHGSRARVRRDSRELDLDDVGGRTADQERLRVGEGQRHIWDIQVDLGGQSAIRVRGAHALHVHEGLVRQAPPHGASAEREVEINGFPDNTTSCAADRVRARLGRVGVDPPRVPRRDDQGPDPAGGGGLVLDSDAVGRQGKGLDGRGGGESVCRGDGEVHWRRQGAIVLVEGPLHVQVSAVAAPALEEAAGQGHHVGEAGDLPAPHVAVRANEVLHAPDRHAIAVALLHDHRPQAPVVLGRGEAQPEAVRRRGLAELVLFDLGVHDERVGGSDGRDEHIETRGQETVAGLAFVLDIDEGLIQHLGS
mmetsp:Transcript_73456/g.224661  ORF Transcript_73456/g.224661 Transcript_73456/m.224661 type:complete len:326 (+) Transcript_73456:1376-2353(+)